MTSKIQTKIQALLNQARDQQGTPEGDVFERKAFELLAKYGLTEFDLEQDTDELHTMLKKEFEVVGKYPREKQRLLASIGHSLGCFVIRVTGSKKTMLAGTNRNVDRTLMLYTMLVAQAESDASKLTAQAGFTTQQVRVSFWIGFANRIRERLAEVEHSVREEATSQGVLVPVNEYREAERFFSSQHLGQVQSSRSRSQLHAGGYQSGSESANRADLGRSRVQGRRELVGR